MTDMSQTQSIASAGKIHLLDLTALKERLGTKWERMAQHVQMFFEAAIRRGLKPGDTFSRLDELSYLIMFCELSAAEAELKCQAISEEVCRRLFGENGEQVSLRNLVAHVGLTSMPVDANQEAALDALLEREGKETVITENSAANRVATRRNVAERNFCLSFGGGAALRERVSICGLGFVYRPIWDSINQVVLTYLCQPIVPSLLPTADAASGFCATDNEGDQAFLDIHVLHECAERAQRLRAAGLRIILAVPVHFMTIARPRAWRDYSAAHQQVRDDVGKDLAFVVFGIDHGVPHIRLAQELPKLSRTAYRVLCTVGQCEGVSARFARTGASGVGTALDGQDDELQSISRIRDVAREAQSAGIDSFVLGLRSTSLALISIHSGIRYLEGPIVRPSVDDPRHGFSHAVEDLYSAKRSAT